MTPDCAGAGASGKAVAWLYEVFIGDGCWSQKYSDTKIDEEKWIRNIRPLYLAAPVQPAEAPAGVREAGFIKPDTAQQGESSLAQQAESGSDPIDPELQFEESFSRQPNSR